MGAANCCKKPEEIVSEDLKKVTEENKINALDQDSYPQDTEYVYNANIYPQEISNQKLYEQENSPKIGGTYEVAINASSPEQYKQVDIQTPSIEKQQINEVQNINQYSPEEIAMYQNQVKIKESPEFNEETNINKQNEEIPQNQIQAEIPLKQSNEPNVEIKQSGISNQGAVDVATLTSQKSAAPVNVISQIANPQQIIPTPENNNKALNIQQKIPTPLIQVKEAEEEEDLNKYFQIPTSLSKTKVTMPSNQVEQKMPEQNIKEEGNVASVTPITGNDDINKYFVQAGPQLEKMTDEDILNKYFTKTTSQEIKPEDLIKNNLNLQNIINMKDLPATFGSNDINNFKQTTTTTTTTTKATGNVDLRNIPTALTSSEIKKIVDMKDLPTTFGSNDINNFKQTTTTTTTKTTGNIDLRNIPSALTSSEVKKIVDMKDLPATFGSNDIKNFKQTTTTTTTQTTGNIPGALTASQIKKIIDMKDLPETIGSSNINNMKKTTVTTTTTTSPTSIDLKGLPATFGPDDIKNLKQTTTTTTTQTTGNIPGALTASQIKKIIDMKDLPETIGSSNINNMKKTTVTTTTTTSPTNIDLKQFGLEQNPSMKLASEPIDLKQFGLEPNYSQITAGKNKQTTTTVTKTVQNNINNVSNPTEDYSKYFQNIQTTSTPIDLKQFGLEKNASNISNILQGSNITFKQPGQSIVSSTNYQATPSTSTPLVSNQDYSKYFQTNKTTTTTTTFNQSGIPVQKNINSNYNLNNYGINIPQGKTTTTTTMYKTSGIPVTTTQSYNLPANYAANKVTTTKVTKTYVGPTTQTSSYNYSYNIPTTTTTTTVRK